MFRSRVLPDAERRILSALKIQQDREFVNATATVLESVQSHALTQGDRVAMEMARGTGRATLTWGSLKDEVEACAAGLARAGLHQGQVVLAAMPLSVEAVLLQYAVGTVGATLLWVHPRIGASELAETIEGAPVRLVVTDDETRLAAWAGVDLDGAELLLVGEDGRGLDQIFNLGLARLAEAPQHLALLDRRADPALVRPRLLTPGSGLRVLAPRVDPSGRSADASSADGYSGASAPGRHDAVLVTGEMADAHVQDALVDHMISGGTLVAVGAASELPDALATSRPAALRLGREVAAHLESLLAEARVAGEPWSAAPGHTLAALAGAGYPRRLSLMARRRIAGAERLSDWYGGRLRELRLEGDATPVVRALARLLEHRCLADDAPATERIALIPGREIVWGDPADLPRRLRGSRSTAFELHRPAAAVPVAHLPSLPLFGGESVLDQLLREQQRAGA